MVEELLLVQSSLGNWTTLNSDNCSKDIIITLFKVDQIAEHNGFIQYE